jgi:hypothetical protein
MRLLGPESNALLVEGEHRVAIKIVPSISPVDGNDSPLSACVVASSQFSWCAARKRFNKGSAPCHLSLRNSSLA